MQPPNNPDKDQTLSQLMDGEWHELNPAESVAQICKDASLRGKWARYHLMRDAIKGEQVQSDTAMAARICAAIADEPDHSNITPFTPVGSGVQRASGVGAQNTEDEADLNAQSATIAAQDESPSVRSIKTSERSSWVGTGAAGFGLAASVALVTVLGMNVWQGQSNLSENQEVAASQALPNADNAFANQLEGAPLPVVEFVANTGSYWVSPQTAERVANEDKLNLFLTQHIENAPSSSREGMLPYSRLVGYDEQNKEQ